MIRKPTSGDSEQRDRAATRARKSSTLSPGGAPQDSEAAKTANHDYGTRPMHGSSDGESAHGAIPRRGIEDE
ncbi:MAG: hypothetical protein ACT4O1_04660 [Gemmatimonadota bacterium]